MTRRYEKLPKNLDQFSDQEIDTFAQRIRQKINPERN